jgi:hypothetical protein
MPLPENCCSILFTTGYKDSVKEGGFCFWGFLLWAFALGAFALRLLLKKASKLFFLGIWLFGVVGFW